MKTHFILYVKDQKSSCNFYSAVLETAPTLDVAGMTEFELSEESVLGLMPESGIRRLLGDALPDPATARGIPRAEIYLVVKDAGAYLSRAVSRGGILLGDVLMRDWGDLVGYCLDPDGHVLAFAQPAQT
ncbi:MAG TPA: glyoxalase [Candidatus Melainabacteria bacterium]|nr:glyoxalase [Candidatus Melainabacteria bacterium]